MIDFCLSVGVIIFQGLSLLQVLEHFRAEAAALCRIPTLTWDQSSSLWWCRLFQIQGQFLDIQKHWQLVSIKLLAAFLRSKDGEKSSAVPAVWEVLQQKWIRPAAGLMTACLPVGRRSSSSPSLSPPLKAFKSRGGRAEVEVVSCCLGALRELHWLCLSVSVTESTYKSRFLPSYALMKIV